MGLRIKLGPFLSVGRTGFRLHLPLFGNGSSISTGRRGGTRAFLRSGPFYCNWKMKGKKR